MVAADLHLGRWLEAGWDPFASLDEREFAFLDAPVVARDHDCKYKARSANMLACLDIQSRQQHRPAAPTKTGNSSLGRSKYGSRIKVGVSFIKR
ncbi:hypothetical protein OEZ60_07370 [Defluviimonas sp. WL0024]|uniref:Uncharacterized protein n=1 Tax=Albidovulum salinarum TaxID=2984153 RepID=A0ABT2X1L7_9RHOB|nr:hypothetical protein [Defluviimonas sp. WL0024]MCU9847823.1 hypothetical protein [Defluviimonas sp. WL0024]